MANRRPLHTLCALFALAVACQPGTAETAADVDEVVLTADNPVAAFEVTLCLTGGAPNGLNLYSTLQATASTSEGEVELTLEALDAEDEAYPGSYAEISNATTTAQQTSISLDTQRDWEASDRRCQEQVVQLSVPELDGDQTVTITDISIQLRAEWAGLCGETPNDDSLSIETARL